MYFPPKFDLKRSIELARLIVQAYDQFDSFQKGVPWTPQDGFTLVKELSQKPIAGLLGHSHTQFDIEIRIFEKAKALKSMAYPIGFIAEKGRNIYIIFRGTITIAEWVRNLNVWLSNYLKAGYGKVHEGFLQTYGIVRHGLLKVLQGLDSRKSLFVAGHSLGAALATLALPEIAASTGFRDPTIYTFGSPRIGDNQFSKSFDRAFADRSFRIANTSDVVVSLPLPAPILGIIGGYFTHIETPVDFTIQENDLERNHIIGTYLSALMAAEGETRLLRKLLRRR